MLRLGNTAGLLIQEESYFFEWEHQEEPWRAAGSCQNMGTVILGWVQPATPVGKAEAGRGGQPCRGTRPEQAKVGNGVRRQNPTLEETRLWLSAHLSPTFWIADLGCFYLRKLLPCRYFRHLHIVHCGLSSSKGARWFLKEEREGARGNLWQGSRPPSSPKAKPGCPCSTELSCSSVRAGVGKRLPSWPGSSPATQDGPIWEPIRTFSLRGWVSCSGQELRLLFSPFPQKSPGAAQAQLQQLNVLYGAGISFMGLVSR